MLRNVYCVKINANSRYWNILFAEHPDKQLSCKTMGLKKSGLLDEWKPRTLAVRDDPKARFWEDVIFVSKDKD